MKVIRIPGKPILRMLDSHVMCKVCRTWCYYILMEIYAFLHLFNSYCCIILTANNISSLALACISKNNLSIMSKTARYLLPSLGGFLYRIKSLCLGIKNNQYTALSPFSYLTYNLTGILGTLSN